MISFPNIQEETLTTRSTSSSFDKALCTVCQCPGGVLNRVEATGDNLFHLNFQTRHCSNSISIAEEAVANDGIYHNLCWDKAKKKAVPKQKPAENYIKTCSNVEILNHIENSLVDYSSEILDMSKLNEVYKKMLTENGENHDNILSNYKKQLKELVEENFPLICFVPNNQKNKAEKLTTKLMQTEAVKLYEEEIRDALNGRLLSKLAKKIRNEVLNQSWQFEGDFSKYLMSPLLLTFMKWILLGPTNDLSINTSRTFVVENLIKTTT